MTNEEKDTYLIRGLTSPDNLKELRDALVGMSDEKLKELKVFAFKWGDKDGTCSWRRKLAPKQYWSERERLFGETKQENTV